MSITDIFISYIHWIHITHIFRCEIIKKKQKNMIVRYDRGGKFK